jgi:hypothetical protein
MQWIIKTDEPFRGHVQSTVNDDGIVDYTKGQTFEQYAAEHGGNVKIISDAELDDLLENHYASLVTKPKRITRARYWEMLEVLPPCRWHDVGGFNVFHVSERLTGNLVSWFIKVGRTEETARFHEFTDRDNLKDSEILAKLKGLQS